jgi:putative tryptophan/tyrosine transport system substrate-binding protein
MSTGLLQAKWPLTRRALLGGMAAGMVARPVKAQGAPVKVSMVVWRGATRVEDGFRDYFAELGIPLDWELLDLGTDPKRIPDVVAHIRARKPDLVYSWGTTTTLGLVGRYDQVDPAKHITDIPVVFTLVAYPVGGGIVPDLEKTGRNVTGTAFLAPIDAQVRAIRAYREISTLAILYNPAEQNSVLNVEELRAVCLRDGLRLVEKPAPVVDGRPDAASVPRLVHEAKADGAEFLYIGPDSFTAVNGEALTEAAIVAGLPTFAATERPLVSAKAMIGLVSNYYTLGKFTADRAVRILVDKVSPESLPVRPLERFSYMLRMDVASALGIYPPLTVLDYAELVA